MGRRPQPNRRRGLLRATAAVVGLIILLIIVVTIVSSLTAPTVKAPTVPPTAGPIARTPVVPTTHPTTPRTRTPKPVPSATARTKKHKHVALGDIILNEHSGGAIYDAAAHRSLVEISPAVQPRGHAVAYFGRADSAYQRVSLLVRRGTSVRRIGYGDRFVRPVWSPGGQYLLYVHVKETAGIPGARWTLLRWNRRTNASRVRATVAALALTPLGWRHGQPLWSVAQPTTTDVYTAIAGHSRRLGTLLAQPLVDLSLSPNSRYLAFGAPDNCDRCTLDIYNLNRSTLWAGPTGMPNGSTLAWTANGSTLVGDMGSRLVVIDPRDNAVRYESIPDRLPQRWPDIMRASYRGGRLSLRDTVTGRFYTDRGAAR